MLTIRENMQLDQIRSRKDSDPVVSEIGLLHSDLCPEIVSLPQTVFQHAGHLWLHTHHEWAKSSTITGTVELFVSTAEDLVPTPVDVQQRSLSTGRVAYFSQFADTAGHMSQCGRNETMAYMIVDRPDHPLDSIMMEALKDLDIAVTYPCTVEMPPELCTPEQIADAEAAIQEAQEGKLDYLLEGTQWDPRNRK
jgi:hypothetical protein